MEKPWVGNATPEKIDIISPQGEIKSSVLGYFAGTVFFIDDITTDIQAGDEIRRALPNGKEQAFTVKDPAYYATEGLAPHYQVKIQPKGTFDKNRGGNYHVTVNGSNSRVNIASHDNSVNLNISKDIFSEIRQTLNSAGIEPMQLASLQKQLAAMEASKDKGAFSKAYQGFVAGLADHITVVAPFLPTLTQLLGKFPA